MAYLYIHHHMSTDDIGLAYGIRGSYSGNVFAGARYRNKGKILLELDENKIKNSVLKVMELQRLHRRWVALPLP